MFAVFRRARHMCYSCFYPLALTIAPGCPPGKPNQAIVKKGFLQAALPGIQDTRARLEILAG